VLASDATSGLESRLEMQRTPKSFEDHIFQNVESAMEELASESSQWIQWPDPHEYVDIYYPFMILYDLFNLREWDEEDRHEYFTHGQAAAVLNTMDELDLVDARHSHITAHFPFQEAMLSDPDWPRVVAAAKKFYEDDPLEKKPPFGAKLRNLLSGGAQ
jgi:hypothetical protein